MNPIVTVTLNPSVDKSCSVGRVVPERKLRCDSPRYEPGGGGLNVTRALQELGQRSVGLWLKGGKTGALLEQLLDEESVPHRPIPASGVTRENLIVFEKETGQQYRFGMPGPSLTQAEIQLVAQEIAEFDPAPEFLILSGSLPQNVSPRSYGILTKAAPEGTKVVLDASGEALRLGLDAGVYMVKPNLAELGQLVRSDLTSDQDIEAAAKELISSKSAELVLVSLGAGGAMLVSGTGAALIRSPTVPIRSKVGAGDSMVAGAVLGLLRHGTMYDAARLGVAAGAAAVMTEGTELCRKEDVDRMFTTLRSAYPSIIPRSAL